MLGSKNRRRNKSEKNVADLDDEKLQRLRQQLKDLKYLIVDEISMVTPRLFVAISQRLQQIMDNALPFGGVNVITVGDFFQLPPVGTSWIFNADEMFCRNQWTKFTPFVFTKNERQSGFDEWQNILNSVRIGALDENVCDFLSKLNNKHLENPDEWKGAIHIFETNKEVDEYNMEMLSKLKGKLRIFPSFDRRTETDGLTSAQADRDKPQIITDCGGLEETLRCKVGARIMVTKNIVLDDKIFNGTIGNIYSLPEDRIGKIEVLLEDPCAGKLTGRKDPETGYYSTYFNIVYLLFYGFYECRRQIIAIKPMISKFRGDRGTSWLRVQFPVRLAYAVTNYKCQGLTLDRIVCHFNRPRKVGSLYTPLSRVPNPANCSIADIDIVQIKKCRMWPQTKLDFIAVHKEYERLAMMSMSLVTVCLSTLLSYFIYLLL